MLAVLFYLGLIITQCVWTSVTETGMDVGSTVLPGADNNTVCVD